MLGAYITIGILIAALVLVILADLYPKIKKYHLQSPIKKVEPRKKNTRRKAARKREIRIRLP